MQVSGASVQDDVLGKFSFIMEGPSLSESDLGKDGLIHGHEPPNIGQMLPNDAFFPGDRLTSDKVDHHGDSVDQGDAEFDVDTAMAVEQAASTSSIRKSLWDYFDGLAQASKLPWLILGDFNDTVCADEKAGGNFDSGGQNFIDWIDRNQLIDLGFSGAKFTWCNKRNAEGIIWKRLDRGLSNIAWRLLFPEAHLSHLPRVNSDHCPVMVRISSAHLPDKDCVPFRFQAMWFTHPEFSEFITDLWQSNNGDAVIKSAGLVSPLVSWNRQVFGCLFRKKRRLLARLESIQRNLCLGFNPYLSTLESELATEYNLILEQEELFWLQKSRNTWLKEGDRNTHFFHLSTVIRRRRNKLEGLNNEAGIWITNKDGMKLTIVNYFQKLFGDTGLVNDYRLLPHLFPRLADSDLEGLSCEVTDDEVKNSLFAIGGLKTPGPDGFPALFYQKCWGMCSADIIALVKNCFLTASLPEKINETLIALVPKVERPVSLTQLRPISLCNTLYKVISKILVARLRPCMASLVSPNQVSFVPGRQIVDNIVVAQEMLHKFKSSKGRKGFIAWKIDLSKAYDRLNWDFIREVLWEVGIRGRILELVMQCINSVHYRAILNDKAWKPIQICQNGPVISHLFFADDLILFGKASVNQATVMKKCLDDFCSLSGQKVSFGKSVICVSPNTSSDLAQAIATICGSPLTSCLGKYLGVPLIHTRVTKATYQEIIDKVQRRLSSWKSHTLSMAGRLTLLQSVTSAIPIYSMQSAKLPVSVCQKLDQLNRNFLWGHTTDQAKVHLVNWDTVCKPKSAGGLGIKNTAWMNQALLAKSGWRLLQREQGLWAQVFNAKYLRHCDILAAKDLQVQSSSNVWKGILYGAQVLSAGVKWRVGSGDDILFWTDRWLNCGPLQQFALIDLSEDMLQLNVSDFLEDGVWDFNCLLECLPINIVNLILCIHAGYNGSGEDNCIWQATSNGQFSVKTAYNTFFPDEGSVNWKWDFIWKLHAPPKVKTFLWLLCHKKLLTNAQRLKRKLSNDAGCPRCGCPSESCAHLFMGCAVTLAIWNRLGFGRVEAGQDDYDDWLLHNLNSKRLVSHGLPWYLVFAIFLWFIWKWR
ncbi:unnamed protein product, partial [Prunus brigantina]